jgi:beta-fructofuranosidase
MRGDRPVLDLDARWYEEHQPGLWHDRAWRDPWVFANPDGGFSMAFTARANIGDPATRGVIGQAASNDLFSWRAEPPMYRSSEFGHLEVPEIAEIEGRWVCLFCTEARFFGRNYANSLQGGAVTGTYYLLGDTPLGPWRLAPGPFLDGDTPGSRYARRVVRHQGSWFYFAFRHTAPDGVFVGNIAGPFRVAFDRDGRLRLGEQLDWSSGSLLRRD